MGKVIVTHKAPDIDAITSVWLLKRFLPGWKDAKVKFVPAGQKLHGSYSKEGEEIEVVGGREVIHVDTGMGALDHHQFQDETKCATTLVFEYVKSIPNNGITGNKIRTQAIQEMVKLVLDEDHFQQVFYPDSDSYIREFTVVGILDGFKMLNPAQDDTVLEFGMECLDALQLSFQSRVQAEGELGEGKEFKTRWGKGIAFETSNDAVMKVAQLKGYVVVVRKDPVSNLLRIKARPRMREDLRKKNNGLKEINIDLTPIYEKVREKDPYASWFLHASKRMLLNGSSKNPDTVPTKLTSDEIIKILSSN